MSLSHRAIVTGVAVAGAWARLAAAPLSTLEAAGDDAFMADFFWWMALGAAVLWVAAMGFLVYCLYGARTGRTPPSPSKVVAGGNVILQSLVLALLIQATLSSIEGLIDGPLPAHEPRIQAVARP